MTQLTTKNHPQPHPQTDLHLKITHLGDLYFSPFWYYQKLLMVAREHNKSNFVGQKSWGEVTFAHGALPAGRFCYKIGDRCVLLK